MRSNGITHDPQAQTTRGLLTAADLAERWHVPASHVYSSTRRGALPAVRLGPYYRYRLDAIERWELAGGVVTDA
jgi:hypothetical protein